MRIDAKRLTLVPATVELARSEFTDRDRFARLLDAEVPPDWPPPLNDEPSRVWVADYLESHPGAAGWAMWYFLLRRDNQPPLVVGCGGLAGKPTEDGTCEIGYAVIESKQRNGYAPEAVLALIKWAFSNPNVTRVIAHTFPSLTPSIRVLEKCGFKFAGEGSEPGTIRYELRRPAR